MSYFPPFDMVCWLKGIVSHISMPLRRPRNIIIPSYLYVRAVGGTPGLGSGSSAPSAVSNDGPSVFKWPVISSKKHIKMDFRWGETDLSLLFLALIIHLAASATCLHRDKMQRKKKKHTYSYFTNQQPAYKSCKAVHH